MRQHIFRQYISDTFTDVFCLHFYACIESANQLPAFVVFPNNYNRIGNTVDRRNRVFNLSEFNTKSSDLYLKVVSADISNVSIPSPIGKISGLVELAAAKRILNKSFIIQLSTVKITGANTITCYTQLSCNSDRNRVEIFVNDKDLRITSRLADRYIIFIRYRSIRYPYGRFSRSVHIPNLRFGQRLQFFYK